MKLKVLEALNLLKKQLNDKQCALAETFGNDFRLSESVVKSFGGAIPEATTAAEIASRMYNFVLADVTGIINGVPGSGQLFWEAGRKPAKLVAFEKSRGVQPYSHLPEKKERRVRVSEASSVRDENIQAMEQAYKDLAPFIPYGQPAVSPRLSVLRGFINDYRENPTFNSKAGLAAVKSFLAEKDVRIATANLQAHLAAERDGTDYPEWKSHNAQSGVRDVREFLS